MSLMRALPVVALLSVALLAGCTETAQSTTDPSGQLPSDPCPSATPTSSVAGFTVHNGNWSLATARSTAVCGEGTKALNSLVSSSLGSFTDLEATLTFKMLERDALEYDAGAGLVLHFQDDANFQIIRYSVREQGWHLFTMTNGTRTKQDVASVTPPTTNPAFNNWIDLRVRSEGGHITAFDGTTKVIDYHLPAGASTHGAIGYFLRAQQAAEFDGLTAHSL